MMRLKLLALLAVLALVGLGGHRALASIEGPPPGEPASINDVDGEEVATITIDEVQDPFEDYSEFSSPDRGTRHVQLAVTIENTGEDTFSISPLDLFLVDSFGRTFGRGFVSVEDDYADENPELEDTDLEPGDEVSGVVYFTVWSDAELTDVLYEGRVGDATLLVSVADLGAGGAATGDDEDATPADDDDEDSTGASAGVEVDDEDSTPES